MFVLPLAACLELATAPFGQRVPVRPVVEEAFDNGYLEENDAFRSVVDRLRAHEGLATEDFYGTWLLEYEAVEYITYARW